MTIGFIGQGFIGKSYADEMERRGRAVVRYSLEKAHQHNKEKIKECEIVFIAVPTPTTPKGFDYSIVEEALALIGKGKTAVIKSTILPGTTAMLQKKFPDIYVMHSPEFLVLKTAAHDAAHPLRNIVGIPKKSKAFIQRAKAVLQTLPPAPFELVCSAPEAEMVKYAGNFFLYFKVLYANLMYEIAEQVGADYDIVRSAIAADPRIGASHLTIQHNSGHKGAKSGRGAGGSCFIKDTEALARLYRSTVGDTYGEKLFAAAIEKNLSLLIASNKDMELVEGVYGKSVRAKYKKSAKKKII